MRKKGQSLGIRQAAALAVVAAIPCHVGADDQGPVRDRIGIDIHQLTDDARLDLIRDSGMGWVPDDVGDWTAAVTTVVTRYRDDIRYWGIWNEPNTTGFWTGTRQQFIDVIVKPAADAIHAADPDARVVGPELAHFVSSGRVFYEWLLDIFTQAGDRIDILSHHTYPRPLAADHTTITRQLDADTAFGDQPDLWGFLGVHPSLREVLEELGWSGGVWLTEFGWRTTDLSEQQIADNYTGLFNDWLTGDPDRNWIDKLLLYHAQTDEYGIFNPDGSPRAAYFAIYDFIDASDGIIEVPMKDVISMAFPTDQGAVYMLEYTEDVATDSWNSREWSILGNGLVMYAFDDTADSAGKYYRIRKVN